MQKICIIGCPGSGKSTFARKLQEITGLPICHLDLLHHKPDRTTVDRDEFVERLNEVLAKDRWIIDGNYNGTMDLRLAACDTVFFFDLPAEVCLAGVEARRGKVRPDMPWIEMEEDPEFTAYIRSFATEKLPLIQERIEQYPNISVIRFSSRAEADEYLLALQKQHP